MKNCFSCKFEKTMSVSMMTDKELREFKPEEHVTLVEAKVGSVLGKRVGKCLAGHNTVLEKFWKDNSHKMSGMVTEELSCHDYHDSTKTLISMNQKADEFLELLKTK